MRKEITTIKVSKKTAEILSKLKIHPRQPYEEVILKCISEGKKSKKHENFGKIGSAAPNIITTIKLSKKTAELLNKLKIHPRQSYEEVILNFIAKNEKSRKKAR